MSTRAFGRLVLVANARLPSERAQSLQVVQMAAAFARAGVQTTLLHAERHPTPPLPEGQDLFDYYAVPEGPRPRVEAVPCRDWIDRVPRRLQFVPARVQELSFCRNAARRASAGQDTVVLSREIETARALAGSGAAVFLELHRVPGGRLRRKWLRDAAREARGIAAISGGVRDDLLGAGIDPALVCVEHDAFEASRFASPVPRMAAREALRLDQKAKVVVYTGGLMPWKGVELLVGAARTLPEVQFVIAGGTEADNLRLQKLARSVWNVRFDGFQPPERIAQYLWAADLGAVPNRSQPAISARYTSPLKVFEAMAAGLPLVVSDLPSLREILPDEDDAAHVRPDDERALADGIAALLADEARRERIRARSLARAGEHTWDARARRLIAWMGERLRT